jgi:hypothetical protein
MALSEGREIAFTFLWAQFYAYRPAVTVRNRPDFAPGVIRGGEIEFQAMAETPALAGISSHFWLKRRANSGVCR